MFLGVTEKENSYFQGNALETVYIQSIVWIERSCVYFISLCAIRVLPFDKGWRRMIKSGVVQLGDTDRENQNIQDLKKQFIMMLMTSVLPWPQSVLWEVLPWVEILFHFEELYFLFV